MKVLARLESARDGGTHGEGVTLHDAVKEAVYKLGLRGRSNGYEPLSGVEWRWDWNGTIVLVSLHSDDDDSFDVGRRKRRKPVLSVSISREQWARMDAMAADSTRSRFLGELIDAEWTRRRAGQ